LTADVAQLVEQRFRKAWVACSSQVIGFLKSDGFVVHETASFACVKPSRTHHNIF
jgi:hypothetical protein